MALCGVRHGAALTKYLYIYQSSWCRVNILGLISLKGRLIPGISSFKSQILLKIYWRDALTPAQVGVRIGVKTRKK